MTKQKKYQEAYTLISDAIDILDGEVSDGFMKKLEDIADALSRETWEEDE